MLTESCCSVMSKSLRPHALQPTRLLCPQDSPGKNTGVGCHVLLQGIFPTQGSKLGLAHCGQILYRLSHLHYPFIEVYKLLELINDYSKVAGYKINTQKSLAFLYSNITVSIFMLVIGLFIFPIFPWFGFGSLYISKNLYIA